MDRSRTLSESSKPRRRVLLVEDEALVARLLIRSLEKSGFEVLFAGDGETALGLAGEQPECPDLLITDFALPGISGVEVARRLSAKWPGLRILLTSGYGFEALQDTATLPRDFQFLPKPFTPGAFLHRVSSMV